jgi:hypothetical protein
MWNVTSSIQGHKLKKTCALAWENLILSLVLSTPESRSRTKRVEESTWSRASARSIIGRSLGYLMTSARTSGPNETCSRGRGIDPTYVWRSWWQTSRSSTLVFWPMTHAGAESELDRRRYAASPSVCTYLVKMGKKGWKCTRTYTRNSSTGQ